MPPARSWKPWSVAPRKATRSAPSWSCNAYGLRVARAACELPELASVADLPAAIGQLLQQVADGTLAPEEGAAVASMLNAQRAAFELVDVERRLRELERRAGK
jgi:hypothetical protein